VAKSGNDLPDVFGRYLIRSKLGEGAMGAVYLAEDSLLHRKVALKTPTFEGDDDGERLRRFHREARAAANLKHPNLCAVYDVGEIDGRHYISMEFVAGKKLSDFIKPEKPMTEKQAMAVVRKIALGMYEAHSQGVIHRDLKPDNIMVNEKGEPVVMDFGLVHQAETKESTRLTQHGMLVGSPAYMSKEQVEGNLDNLTRATDQYSLGVILYQLLTSELPFDGGLHAVLAAIMTQEPLPPREFRPDLNPHLEAVCLKMMSKEAEDRYESMKDVADALAEVAKGTSTAAGSVVVPPQITRSMTGGITATFMGSPVPSDARSLSHRRNKPPKEQKKQPDSRIERRVEWIRREWRGLLIGVSILIVCGIGVAGVYEYMAYRHAIDMRSMKLDVERERTRADQSSNAARALWEQSKDQQKITQENSKEAERQKAIADARAADLALLKAVAESRPPGDETLLGKPQSTAEPSATGSPTTTPKPAIAPFDAATAKHHQAQWAAFLGVPVEWTNSIGMEFRKSWSDSLGFGSSPVVRAAGL
jgi:serine/threonine protein kinase